MTKFSKMLMFLAMPLLTACFESEESLITPADSLILPVSTSGRVLCRYPRGDVDGGSCDPMFISVSRDGEYRTSQKEDSPSEDVIRARFYRLGDKRWIGEAPYGTAGFYVYFVAELKQTKLIIEQLHCNNFSPAERNQLAADGHIENAYADSNAPDCAITSLASLIHIAEAYPDDPPLGNLTYVLN